MSDNAQRIAENLQSVRRRMAAAAARCERSAGDVRLVAVTKYVGDDAVAALVEAGCRDFGESRPQALWTRAERFRRPDVRWHLIGHLQRNKVARTLPVVELIHSVDSERLLAAIDAEAARQQRTSDVLLEVNVSGDASKHGVAPEELAALVVAAGDHPHVRVCGLMTMAAREGNAERARCEFARLRALRDDLRADDLRRPSPPNVQIEELSMGMSGDFEEAIEQGATIVRIGSMLFEGTHDADG